MRVNVYISSSGFCSRRQADRYVLEGKVFVNGKQADVGQDVSDHDEVIVDGVKINKQVETIYLAFHKPIGVICTTDESIEGNITSYINYPERIFPIGRLDKDSSGLILLTNDGQIVNPILRKENGHDKEYVVTLDKPITDEFIKEMEEGVTIYNPVTHQYTKTLKTKVKKLANKEISIILNQGLNLQIRRMAKALGYHVVKLKRIRIMHILLNQLKPGEYRHLTQNEQDELLNSVFKNSKKTL